MNSRRQFLRDVALAATATAGITSVRAAESPSPEFADGDHRLYWFSVLQRVAAPVLTNLAANKLRERMPIEAPAGTADARRKVTHLEAFGRTLAGIAPWLELADKPAAESEPGRRLAELARRGLANATDAKAQDFMNFTTGAQPLVDAAFLVHGILRARRELWEKLDSAVQQRLIAALQGVRKIKPGNNNWLLFSAMVETFLASVGVEWNAKPIETALRSHEQWYKGDGIYGDGPEFHWDYYNSYVIQPFLIDVLGQIGKVTPRWAGLLENVLQRARRYAAVQERLIAPDGSFPALGRSLAYRCGAFHLLAQMALRGQLPEGIQPGQTRNALTAVLRRTMEAPGTFDADGWLRIGLCGHQPSIAESYISTGSLYLCTFALLPLGLPVSHPFWAEPATDWTSRKIWSSQDTRADHALKSAK
jgi:hypothetical protein